MEFVIDDYVRYPINPHPISVKRIFLIVLDSLGAGEMPDAADFGDKGANTLRSLSRSRELFIPNLKKLGIGNIDGLGFLGTTEEPKAAVCKVSELSNGKDSTVGHWEMAGVVSPRPLPTFPDGFPQEIIDRFSALTGRGVLCNKPYSGTQVIADYGEEHLRTGDLIVYTSADSVFQVAAHEDVVPVEQLYEYCEAARKLLTGDYGVGRVIARPFVGEQGNFIRTPRRHDFSIVPPSETVLDALKAAGKDVISVGKIKDLFAERGLTQMYPTSGNAEGMARTMELIGQEWEGLCFVNLVDFDMLYGHRQDVDGYARALSEFDQWLGEFLPKLREDDLLMITADHGCDPADNSTDHTREYIPLLLYGRKFLPVNLEIQEGFTSIAATIADFFELDYQCEGLSMRAEISDMYKHLLAAAERAMRHSYSPYSNFKVGAALMTKQGKIYTGCNLENGAFSPTMCAERVAFAKALSAGEKEFTAMAIMGGYNGEIDGPCPPCGVCRQVIREYCDAVFRVIVLRRDTWRGKDDLYEVYDLHELLPVSFRLK